MRRNQIFNDSTKYWCDRNKRIKKWQWRKNDAVIVVALVACTKFGVNRPKQTKVIERKLIFLFLVKATLTLITDTWVAIQSCLLIQATHTAILVSIDQSKLKLLSGNWISIFSKSDLDLNHRHLGSNSKLPLDTSYPYSKFGVNRPKQIKITERKLNFHF